MAKKAGLGILLIGDILDETEQLGKQALAQSRLMALHRLPHQGIEPPAAEADQRQHETPTLGREAQFTGIEAHHDGEAGIDRERNDRIALASRIDRRTLLVVAVDLGQDFSHGGLVGHVAFGILQGMHAASVIGPVTSDHPVTCNAAEGGVILSMIEERRNGRPDRSGCLPGHHGRLASTEQLRH